jgi:hypothetical protein
MPDTYPTKKELRARERYEPDWHATIRRDKRGGIRVSGADDSVLRLGPSGSSHLKVQIHDSEDFLAGVVLDRGRVEWLRERLGEWLESGQVGGEETADGHRSGR